MLLMQLQACRRITIDKDSSSDCRAFWLRIAVDSCYCSTEIQPRSPPRMTDALNESSHTAAAEKISSCGCCQARLSLRRPSAAEPATCWRCRACGTLYLAAPELREGSIFRGGISLASDADVFGRGAIAMSGANLLSGVELQHLDRLTHDNLYAQQGLCDAEVQRRAQRFKLTTAVTVIPLADDFQIVGFPARALTLDISCGGVALLHKSPIEGNLLAVDFAPSGTALPAVILHATRCARTGSGYTISGEFLCRVEC